MALKVNPNAIAALTVDGSLVPPPPLARKTMAVPKNQSTSRLSEPITVVVDENLISSPKPDDLPASCKALIEQVAGR